MTALPHEPGPFGIACWSCGKRIKSAGPACTPNHKLDPMRYHPLTGTLMLVWLIGVSVWLMGLS